MRISRVRLLPCFCLATLLACGGESDGSSTTSNDSSIPPNTASASTVFGVVTGGSDLTKVTITLDPGGASVQPNASGEYEFDDVADGTYTISPSLFGYVFDPPSRTLTVSGASMQEYADQNFVMTSTAAANTPAIPLPNSAVDELPSKSEELVTNIAPVKDFSPYVDASEFSNVCGFTVTANVTLVQGGVSVQGLAYHSYKDCGWFSCDTKTITCTGPVVESPPYLRRTVYWQKVFQALVGPGASYSQAWTITNGSSTADAETMSRTLKLDVGVKINWLQLGASITEMYSRTVTVTLSESQSVTQTFSCPASGDAQSRLFAVWQLHERFDFSDESGKVAWSDPVYHPTSQPSLAALDNAMPIFYESTTTF